MNAQNLLMLLKKRLIKLVITLSKKEKKATYSILSHLEKLLQQRHSNKENHHKK